MCLLLESIKIANGQPQNLNWHQQRLDASRRALLGPGLLPIDLREVIDTSQLSVNEVYKARVLCDRQLQAVELTPYRARRVQTVKLLEADNLDYKHKFADRREIDRCFAQRGQADDVLFVRDGYLTDCSYSNIALWDGSGWVTPATPLLAGTKRQQLLAAGALKERHIRPNDLASFEKLTLINAMLDPGEVALPVTNIIF